MYRAKGVPYLEIVARRAWSETYSAVWQANAVRELARASTGPRIRSVLTGQFAEFSLIDIRNDVAREETLGEIPLETYRSGTLAVDTQLQAEKNLSNVPRYTCFSR